MYRRCVLEQCWNREMFEVGVVGQSLEREWEEMDSVPFQALLFHKCVVQL